MRKTLIALSLAALIPLSGCFPGSQTTDQTNLDLLRDTVVEVCGFLPAASTLTAVATAFGGEAALTAGIISQVANVVCNAVQPQASGTFASPLKKAVAVNLNGKIVIIDGEFVK